MLYKVSKVVIMLLKYNEWNISIQHEIDKNNQHKCYSLHAISAVIRILYSYIVIKKEDFFMVKKYNIILSMLCSKMYFLYKFLIED